jgi:hypothetical protein
VKKNGFIIDGNDGQNGKTKKKRFDYKKQSAAKNKTLYN